MRQISKYLSLYVFLKFKIMALILLLITEWQFEPKCISVNEKIFEFTQYCFQIILLQYWVVSGGELEPWFWILEICRVIHTLVHRLNMIFISFFWTSQLILETLPQATVLYCFCMASSQKSCNFQIATLKQF